MNDTPASPVHVLCLGMFRSGGTWSYNVAREILRLKGDLDDELPGFVGVGDGHDVDVFIRRHVASNPRDTVFKCHFPGPGTLAYCAEASARVLFTHRDPRDAVASRVKAFGRPFELCVSQLVEGWRHYQAVKGLPTILTIPYAEVTGAPEATIGRMAAFLDRPVGAAEAAELAGRFDRERLSREMAEKAPTIRFDPVFRHDPETLLHKTHFTHGGFGFWRDDLTQEQARIIEDKLAPWFQEFGYGAG